MAAYGLSLGHQSQGDYRRLPAAPAMQNYGMMVGGPLAGQVLPVDAAPRLILSRGAALSEPLSES